MGGGVLVSTTRHWATAHTFEIRDATNRSTDSRRESPRWMQNSEYQKVAEVRGGRRIWAETARHSAPVKAAGLYLQSACQAATRELAMDVRLRKKSRCVCHGRQSPPEPRPV